jgi:hypothetical protein
LLKKSVLFIVQTKYVLYVHGSIER